MKYQHMDINQHPLQWQPGKAVCVGRNYVDHIHELNNTTPTTPLLFMKPTSAMIDLTTPIQWPTAYGSCHYELELALLITETISKQQPEQIQLETFYYGLAIDLTLRDLQNQLKNNGHPWEKAKAFDGSCVLSPFMHSHQIKQLNNIEFKLSINNEIRQHGLTQQMMTTIPELISTASQFFTLEPGDVFLTGTPAGVGPLRSKDQLKLYLNDYCFNHTITVV
ncbi:fumarylacetoacetate hydrolase family protein [Piscirickettsia salmonis]|uniref:fumarylacetoacetate hydrolase family protein n=1 Tax=Piscirickettsia salmonis TaxID=1238 RepID=UPI0007C91497|nr:Ureidoglycolate lyase [Piscirickettsiaceae bacterium NZ-RLO1]